MFPNVTFPNRLEKRKNHQILLVDTDVLSDICKGGKSKLIEEYLLNRKFILLYSLTSIMELGFGSSHLSSKEETNLSRSLYLEKTALNDDLFVTQFSLKYKLGQLEEYRGSWIAVSPDCHNWYAAKKTLVSYMDDRGALPKNAKKLQIDALLSCAAWNAGAFLWTNNIKDHLLATYYMSHLECTRTRIKNYSKESVECLAKHMVPIFDSTLLDRAINGELFNIFSEMKKKTDDADIIKVLSIAETL